MRSCAAARNPGTARWSGSATLVAMTSAVAMSTTPDTMRKAPRLLRTALMRPPIAWPATPNASKGIASPTEKRQRQHREPPTHPVGGREHGDRRQDRPRARHEHQPQREPHDKPVAVAIELRQPRVHERPLEQVPYRGNREPQPDHKQGDDACPTEDIVGQIEGRNQGAAYEGEHREARHEAADHHERAAAIRGALLDRRGEDRRQHREHTGADGGDGASDEPYDDEGDHSGCSEPTTARMGFAARMSGPAKVTSWRPKAPSSPCRAPRSDRCRP